METDEIWECRYDQICIIWSFGSFTLSEQLNTWPWHCKDTYFSRTHSKSGSRDFSSEWWGLRLHDHKTWKYKYKNTNMKTNSMPKTNTFREHTLSMILENCDLVTIKSDTGQPSLFLLHGSNPVKQWENKWPQIPLEYQSARSSQILALHLCARWSSKIILVAFQFRKEDIDVTRDNIAFSPRTTELFQPLVAKATLVGIPADEL